MYITRQGNNGTGYVFTSCIHSNCTKDVVSMIQVINVEFCSFK